MATAKKNAPAKADELTPAAFMASRLAASGVTTAQGKALGLQAYTTQQSEALGLQRVGMGFKIPYYGANGKVLKMYRYRYGQITVVKGFLKGAKLRKYDQPAHTNPEIYLPPVKGMNWQAMQQAKDIQLVITEGEIKAACATVHGQACIGVGGVWSFGCKRLNQELLPELEAFNWDGRMVYICYDSDALTNPDIVKAENRLARLLTDRGAVVHVVRLPPTPGSEAKVGLDDYIVEHGAPAFEKLLLETEEWALCSEMHQLNSEVVYIKDPSMIAVYPDGDTPLEKRGQYIMCKCSTFKTELFSERVMAVVNETTGKVSKISAAAEWLKWIGRSKVHSVSYWPGHGRIVDHSLNLWTGWGCEPIAGDMRPWHQLMDNHFVEDQEARHWFHQWLAYPLQHPGCRMNVACVVWSAQQGNGKSSVGNTLRRIYGNNFGVATKAALMGNFNSWTANKQFIMGEEITGGSSREAADILKNMITGEDITVNTKNVPHYTIRNCINYYFTSNHPDAFYLQSEDRRFFIHELTQPKLPPEFWTKYKEWQNGAGPSALFDYLLRYDLTGFNPDAEAPHTKARQEMIDTGLSHHAAWCKELKEYPDNILRIGGTAEGIVIQRGLYTSRELIDLCTPPDKGRQISAKALGAALRAQGFRQVARGQAVATGNGMRQHVWAIRDPKLAELGQVQAGKAYIDEFELAAKQRGNTKFKS